MQSLAERTGEQLRAWIIDHALRDGDKLPPEHELIEQLKISRTVLREAVAGLRGRGELTSRRGSGVFVSKRNNVALQVQGDDMAIVPDVLQLLEIRAAVEVEAASLAARRRSEAALAGIRAALLALESTTGDAEADAAADLAFHRAIAEATENPQFTRFILQMGQAAIPRHRLRASRPSPEDASAYAQLLLAEHQAIARAIEQKDPTFAAAAMRQHLMGSAQRYRAAIAKT